MKETRFCRPKATTYQLPHSFFCKLVGNLYAACIILLPAVTYYGYVTVFEIAGIPIDVRFMLMCLAIGIPVVGLAVFTRFAVPHTARALFFLIVIGSVSSLIDFVNPKWVVPQMMRLLSATLALVLSYNLASEGIWSREKFLKWTGIALVVPVSSALLQLLFGWATILNDAARVSGSFESVAGFGLFLMTMSLILLGRVDFKVSHIVVVAVVLFTLFNTFSRQIIVASILGVLMVTYMQGRVYAFMWPSIILSVIVVSIKPDVIHMILYRFEAMLTIDLDVIKRAPRYVDQYKWIEGGLDNSILTRLQTTILGWRMFMDEPLLGIGFGAFVPSFEAETGRSGVAMHNDYMLYLVETGLLGFFTYIYVQYRVFKCTILRAVREGSEAYFAYSIGVAFVALYVFSFLNNPYYFFEVQMWVWSGLGIVMAEFDSKNGVK